MDKLGKEKKDPKIRERGNIIGYIQIDHMLST